LTTATEAEEQNKTVKKQKSSWSGIFYRNSGKIN